MNRRFSKDGKPRCTVCRHPNKDKIDAYLLSGASPGYVERKFEGLKIGAIRRHKKLHLETVLPSRLDPPDISECSTNSLKMGDIAGQVRQLYQKAREDMDLAKETGDIPTSLKGNAQALKCLEVYFKASEAAFKLQKDSPGNTNLSKLRTVITKALKDHPEARKEVAKALIKSNLS